MTRRPHISLTPEAKHAALSLGERLRKARLRRNMTLEDAASRLGIHRETLSQVERGNPNAAIGTVVGALWVYGLLPTLTDVASPELDMVGRSLEAVGGRQRARPGLGGMDNDF
ncbi:helix-turn-helix transcriptional regulator [Bosea sp. 685]|uniref:helix-turn-helix domain-containing protein n=1 Tax=Bosea sp. 685 TaxID=3080057 RepID=UPI002892BF80|nr:helix-turn-helix transcriptional regulator [Bosea sp. 685]WNJ89564.1 helix-turn-helix transcriptional regulator [Bosea sp. 685]